MAETVWLRFDMTLEDYLLIRDCLDLMATFTQSGYEEGDSGMYKHIISLMEDLEDQAGLEEVEHGPNGWRE